MPPRKRQVQEDPEEVHSSSQSRHKRDAPAEDTHESPATPSKRRRTLTRVVEPEEEEDEDESEEEREDEEPEADTSIAESQSPEADPIPTPKKRGRPPKNADTPVKLNDLKSTPKASQAKSKLDTPVKINGINGTVTPSRRNGADRSARRKSARALIDRVVGGATSDDEAGDEHLAREIYESSDENNEGEEEEAQNSDEAAEELEAATPSKTPRGGKRKARARKKSPTPPRDLPPHERYFFQNKPGLSKTSNNTIASLDLLTHDEYFSVLREYKDPHAADVEFLQDLHAQSFGQWTFELNEGFSVCLYGYGSKRPLLHRFAKHLYTKSGEHKSTKIVIINGYVRATTVREILTTIGSAIDPTHKLASGNPVVQLQDVLSLLSTSGTTSSITLIINSADAPPMRKSITTQAILSQLAAHPRIRLACSVDAPDFPLLWDSGQRSSFNFVFHDCTTFAPRSSAELEVVDEVHELLGRKARRVGGKDGVAFVLKSLPENAKNLFRLLVGEVLVALEEGEGENPGVEYRMLYNKAQEDFICSSEMAFRTLLKE